MLVSHVPQVRGPGTYKELHLGNLLVDILHELNNKIDQLVLQHLVRVEVCY